jgi:TrmH family RNA methyltransferase
VTGDRAPLVITSRANERVKQIRALRDKRARDATGTFFAEGRRLLQAAVNTGAVIEQLLVVPERLDEADAALANEIAVSVPTLEVTGDVFDSVSFREEAQSLGAVVKQRWEALEMSTEGRRCWVALQDIQHPGNLGTVIRTNDAIGGDGVILSGRHTDPYHPIAVRGTLGAIFSQRLVRGSEADVARWARQGGMTVVGTSPWGQVDYREVDYASKPVLLISGSERIGLSDQQMALCDAVIRIPMAGQVESLNLAVATALVLYEVLRQNGG